MSKHSSSLHPLEFLIIFALGAYLAGLLKNVLRESFPVLADTVSGQLLSGLWLQNGLMLILLLLFLRGHKMRPADIGFKQPVGRKPIMAAVIAGFMLYILMRFLLYFLNMLWPGGMQAQNVQGYMQPGASVLEIAFVIATMGIMTPLVEELLYRGYLYQSFRGYLPESRAMLFTALIFGCAHLDVQRAVPLAIGGYLLNVVAVRYESVIASAVSHGVWNTMMMVIYYLAI